MGNIMSPEENFNFAKNSQDENRISYTATGRHSTPLFNRKNSNLIRPKFLRNSCKPGLRFSKGENEFNSKLLKEIFPPPTCFKIRSTISSNTYQSKDSINNISFNRSQSLIMNSTLVTNTEDFTRVESSIGNYLKLNSTQEDKEYIEKVDTEISLKKQASLLFSNNYSNDYELKFIKSGEDLRRRYIAKLIVKQVWKPKEKEKDHNSLIIFDWDDTLLCTSFLTPNGLFNEEARIPDKDLEKIKKLESHVLTILNYAIKCGDTYIVTNAAPGWVEYSARRFYPSVALILNNVTIVSARGEYEKKHPGDSRQWKVLAFLEMLKTFDTQLVTNLICLGDSIIEMEAAHILASKFQQAYIKTVKFRESPKPEELHKQLQLVIEQFSKIFSSVKNLTVRVERRSKGDEKVENTTVLTGTSTTSKK
jgi:hypothetical protein